MPSAENPSSIRRVLAWKKTGKSFARIIRTEGYVQKHSQVQRIGTEPLTENITYPRGHAARRIKAKRYAGLYCNGAEVQIKSCTITNRSNLHMALSPLRDRNPPLLRNLKSARPSVALNWTLNRLMCPLLRIDVIVLVKRCEHYQWCAWIRTNNHVLTAKLLNRQRRAKPRHGNV